MGNVGPVELVIMLVLLLIIAIPLAVIFRGVRRRGR